MYRIIIILALFSINCLYAQKEYYNWYFGDSAAISFNSPTLSPFSLTDSKMKALEGCSSISDDAGNLLFYTNGMSIWNRKHKIMLNGDSLAGGESSAQSSLIIKIPSVDRKYIVFTTDVINFKNGLQYSIVDMDLDGGMGAVVTKNIKLLDRSCEKLASTHHFNEKDIWVLARGYNSPYFYAYLVTARGLQPPVISNIGANINHSQFTSGSGNVDGILKFSPDGSRVVSMNEPLEFFELFDFSNQSGKLSRYIQLFDTLSYKTGYGAEFSPDSKLLYATLQTPSNTWGLFQFMINLGDATSILNSVEILDIGSAGALQLGPDGKIYAIGISAMTQNGALGVIKFPNIKGPGCIYDVHNVILASGRSSWGLPNIISTAYLQKGVILSSDPACINDTVFFKYKLYGDMLPDSVNWFGPDGYITSNTGFNIPNATSKHNGVYKLYLFYNKRKDSLQTSLTVNPKPKFTLYPDNKQTICSGDSARFFIQPDFDIYKYSWSSGDTSRLVYLKKEGKYYVTVTNDYFCSVTDSLELFVQKTTNGTILAEPDTMFCSGDSVKLTMKPDGFSYLWEDGSAKQSVYVKKGGISKGWIISANGCKSESQIMLNEITNIPTKITHIATNGICEGDSLQITAVPDGKQYKYLWSTGETTKSIYITKKGLYSVKVMLGSTCFGTAFENIEVYPKPIVKIAGSDVLCKDDSLLLSSINTFRSYKWSPTDDSTRSIYIKKPGKYILNVVDDNGCTAADTLVIYEMPLLINLTSDSLKFDSVCVNKSLSRLITLYNESNFDIKINKCNPKNYPDIYKSDFPNTPLVLKARTRLDFNIIFSPVDFVDYPDLLELEISEPCIRKINYPINGSGIAIIDIWSPDTIAKIGTEKFEFPIYASINCGAEKLQNIDFFTNVIIDKSLLTVIINDNPEVTSNTINGNNKVLEYRGKNKSIYNVQSLIGKITAKILLADSNITNIILDGFKFDISNLVPKIHNGSIQVKGICKPDISRVKLLELLDFQISPNPSEEDINIRFSNLTDNPESIYLFSDNGSELISQKIVEQNLIGSDTDYKIKIHSISSGNYLVVVKFADRILVKQLKVIK